MDSLSIHNQQKSEHNHIKPQSILTNLIEILNMTLEALENAPTFAEEWQNKSPPYELPNGEVITQRSKPYNYFTVRGQEHSITNEIPNIITLHRKPTKELFAGYELFFIFEKIGLINWRFRTIDIDGKEETHKIGRYTAVREYTQDYLEQYANFNKLSELS